MPISTEQVERAEAAIAQAQRTRRYHARKTDKKSPQRKADIDIALDSLKSAMKPVRSALAKLPSRPQTATTEAEHELLRTLSSGLQRERRKLWKMRKNW